AWGLGWGHRSAGRTRRAGVVVERCPGGNGCPRPGAHLRPCPPRDRAFAYTAARRRSAGLSILPTAFFGSVSATSLVPGRLYFAKRRAQRSCSSSSSGPAPGAQRDVGDDELAEHVVGPADDRGLEHGVVAVESGLDLLGVDVLASADDHVLDAVDDLQVAV